MTQALFHYLTAEQQLAGVEIRVSAKNLSPWATATAFTFFAEKGKDKE
jgi:hypothetical protein